MYFNTVRPLIQRASQQLCISLSTAKDHIFPSILAQNDLTGKKIMQEVVSYYSFQEI